MPRARRPWAAGRAAGSRDVHPRLLVLPLEAHLVNGAHEGPPVLAQRHRPSLDEARLPLGVAQEVHRERPLRHADGLKALVEHLAEERRRRGPWTHLVPTRSRRGRG